MRKGMLLVWLIIAAMLLAVPAMAAEEAQEKSWDVNGDRIYNIYATNDGGMTVIVDGTDDIEFGVAVVLAADWIDPTMRGTWYLGPVGEPVMDVTVIPDSIMPAATFLLKSPEPGKSGMFNLVYISDSLQNPLSKLIAVSTLPAGAGFVDDFAYDKTEHDIKAGHRYYVDAPELLPEGAPLLQEVQFTYDDSSFDFLKGTGKYDCSFDYSDGSFSLYVGEPGTYTFIVGADFASNVTAQATHTFTVTGADTDHELPDFKIWAEVSDGTRVYDPNITENKITYIELLDTFGYEQDQLVWSVVQTAGETVATRFDRHPDGCRGELYVDGVMPAGKYAFTVTLEDVTRDETDSVDIDVEVKVNEERLLDDIYYAKLKDQMTLKAGQTLNFGSPKLFPVGCVVAPDTEYGVWIEGDLGDAAERMILEDPVNGKHKIVGILPGTYRVHTFVSMFAESVGAEYVFDLTVQEAKKQATSITLSHEGTLEEPYKLEEGKTLKLKATMQPKGVSKAVSWVSQYPYIVSVSDKGVIKGLAVGDTVEIRAYTKDGSNLSASIFVEVVNPKATKLTMNKKKLNMKVADLKQLSVKFKPANLPDEQKGLVWLSDNTQVAEVTRDDGYVIAKAPGKAIIYAYGVDENGQIDRDLFAKCTVTVK